MLGSSRTRAAAIVQRYSSVEGGDAAAMAVPGLGRKFWTMTSWTWPWRRCAASIAASASSRSARVSPMPTRMPVVKGIWSSPAASRVASRRAGSLVSQWKCGPPRSSRRSESDSSIMPWLAVTGRSLASSSDDSAPALACGSSPVSATTSRHASAR